MIGQIPLDLIDPNPFRDFDLHPLDQGQIERLKASIHAGGFWASVAARQVGKRFQLAFGHHRIEAARREGLEEVPIDVRDISDWQMVMMLTSENATQRGTTAAASLDSIAAISKALARDCFTTNKEGVSRIFETLPRDAAESVLGKMRLGEGPGEPCVADTTPAGTFSRNQIRLALGILKDSGRMSAIIADARGDNQTAAAPRTFDANCAQLFKLDYHLSEFRRIVTDETVQSYLPVSQQFAFAERIIAELGDTEMTGMKLREKAHYIFYAELGIPRAAMRNSNLREQDARVRDALNLMRRGTHDFKHSCRLLAALIAEGTDVSPEVVARFKDYIAEINLALQSLTPEQPGKKRSSNLRLIVDNRENVA
jgi:hypothetical protein